VTRILLFLTFIKVKQIAGWRYKGTVVKVAESSNTPIFYELILQLTFRIFFGANGTNINLNNVVKFWLNINVKCQIISCQFFGEFKSKKGVVFP
jgi:hypothetical protein